MTKVLLALSVFGPALIAALGVPLALGKVPPNGTYGYRTARSLGSPETWYQMNRVAGLTMIWAGLAALATACLVWLLLDVSPEAKVGLSTAALAAAAAAIVVVPFFLGPRP